ncbi:MAG: YceI family protein [Melioribacteraceae bacterium]|nr:YceI family protein [Melioribacteraceae bacterium]
MKALKYIFFVLLFPVVSIFAQTKWNIDVSHSNVGFEVDHMVIATAEGEFKSYEGTIETDGDDFTNAKINLTIDVASIDTDNEQRDNHLKSDDFFNAEKFPQMTFVGKSMTKVNGNNWKLVGDFTIRDITKEVTLDVKFRGMVKDPWGNTRAGFKLTGEVNRFDYNLKWNKLLETGGLVVSEDVKLIIDLELIKASQS